MTDHHSPVRSPEYRRSRMGWPLRTGPTTTSAGTHDHEMPRPRWVAWGLAALALAVILLATAFALQLKRQVSFTEYRNQQQRQIEQDMRQGFCDLLDQLPQSAVLDAPRHKYGCGPGIPVDQLPPSVRQRWQGGTTAPASPQAFVPSPPAVASSAAPQPTAPAAPLSGASNTRTPAPDIPEGTRPPGFPAPTQPPRDPLLCRLAPLACSLGD